MLYKGNLVETSDLSDSLKEFIQWLPQNCILVGRNVKQFDSRILVNSIHKEELIASFSKKCNGFADKQRSNNFYK